MQHNHNANKFRYVDLKTIIVREIKRDEYCVIHRPGNSGGSGPWVGITPTVYAPYVTNSEKTGSGNER